MMYWPGPNGVLAETDLAGTINEEYVYFNGQRIARVDRPSVIAHYYFSAARRDESNSLVQATPVNNPDLAPVASATAAWPTPS